jgi:DNA-binding transcriptional ArsR family regulator
MDHFLTVLKALADETRLKLVDVLLTQDICGRAAARRLGISEAAVSQHLRILKDAGLVLGEKRGYWTHYSVQGEVLEEIGAELERMTERSAKAGLKCRRVRAQRKGYSGKEVKTMCCKPCCEQPEKLKGKPEECTPEQIRECHGDVKNHPCEEEKKEGK